VQQFGQQFIELDQRFEFGRRRAQRPSALSPSALPADPSPDLTLELAGSLTLVCDIILDSLCALVHAGGRDERR
jgi:hypothetical protein